MSATLRKVVAAAAVLCLSGTAMAGVKYDVYGVLVSISVPGSAGFDGTDGTVTVLPYYDYAAIKITAGKAASVWWPGYCDVFILANGMDVKSLSMKGSGYVPFFTTGQTYHCFAFKTALTNVGYTDYYGSDYGLGMSTASPSYSPNTAISMKYGVCYAPCLAYTFFSVGKSAVDRALPEEGRKLLFGE